MHCIYHDIEIALSDCAQIREDGNALIVTDGLWPDFAGPIGVRASRIIPREGERFIFLNRSGEAVCRSDFVPYGRNVAGVENEMCDLLAWHEDDGWHVKRLVGIG